MLDRAIEVPLFIKNSLAFTKAFEFAAYAHYYRTEDGEPQYRKFSEDLYITHPVAVAAILYNQKTYSDANMIIAAILHDVVEDTTVEHDEIAETFGEDVSYLVKGCTKKSMGSPEVRSIRKALDRDSYASYCSRVQTIKVADVLHNSFSAALRGMEPNGFNWAMLWLSEAQDLLGALMMADSNLRDKTIDIVDAYIDLLQLQNTKVKE
jgi:(p)ppGpp synthase/HD superfamily hydrolase